LVSPAGDAVLVPQLFQQRLDDPLKQRNSPSAVFSPDAPAFRGGHILDLILRGRSLSAHFGMRRSFVHHPHTANPFSWSTRRGRGRGGVGCRSERAGGGSAAVGETADCDTEGRASRKSAARYRLSIGSRKEERKIPAPLRATQLGGRWEHWIERETSGCDRLAREVRGCDSWLWCQPP
jgi:hypothetical protein